MSPFKPLTALILCCFACGGPPSKEDSGVQPMDAGSDAGPGSNVGPVVREGDTLIADSFGNRVVFAPGLAACLQPSLLHADGTGEDLTDALITTANPAVALGGNSTDCGRGLGVIALAPGSTVATVRYEHNGRSVEGTIPVVVAADLSITSVGLRLVPIVPAGTEARYPEQISTQIGVLDVSDWSKLDCACDVAWRYVTLSTGDAQLATVQRLATRRWTISGRARGTTTLGGVLAVPGQPPLTLTDATLNVPGAGTLFAPNMVRLVDDAGEFLTGPMHPDTCYQAQLWGSYSDSVLTWQAPLTAGVTWQSRTAAATIDQSGRACVARGDVVLAGCAASACSFLAQSVWKPGDVLSLNVTQTATGSVRPTDGPWSSGEVVVCPHVRLSAALSDGGVLPLTESPSVRWTSESDAGIVLWPRFVNGDGVSVQDPSGNPCLRANPPNGLWPAQPFDVGVTVGYGLAPSLGFTMSVEHP